MNAKQANMRRQLSFEVGINATPRSDSRKSEGAA